MVVNGRKKNEREFGHVVKSGYRNTDSSTDKGSRCCMVTGIQKYIYVFIFIHMYTQRYVKRSK